MQKLKFCKNQTFFSAGDQAAPKGEGQQGKPQGGGGDDFLFA